MKSKIEIVYKGITFSVIPPFSILFHDMDPQAMGIEIEKGLQIISVYTLSYIASLINGFSYECVLENSEKGQLFRGTLTYRREKYTIIQNFTNSDGNHVLHFDLPLISIEKRIDNCRTLSEDSIDEMRQHVLKESNSFFNVITSYKKGDEYKAFFYDYEKGYEWKILSTNCPGSVTYKKLCSN